jgi:hypothetical protein
MIIHFLEFSNKLLTDSKHKIDTHAPCMVTQYRDYVIPVCSYKLNYLKLHSRQINDLLHVNNLLSIYEVL